MTLETETARSVQVVVADPSESTTTSKQLSLLQRYKQSAFACSTTTVQAVPAFRLVDVTGTIV